MDPTAKAASELLARWNAMKTARQQWDVLWDDCGRYILPRKGQILTILTPGQQQTINLYDTTAGEAANIGAAGMMTHIMPAGEKWFRFQPKGDASDEFKQWLDEASEAVLDALHAGKFYQTAHEDCLDDLIFGSSLMLLEEGRRNALNFVNIPVGTFAWAEDAEGYIDTVGREWKWTARQAAQKWGKERLGKNQRAALDSPSPTDAERQFTYVHFIEPRADTSYEGGAAIGARRPIRSCYVCVEDQQIIEEGGYYSMPYLGSRLLRSNNEIYGRGPGTDAMPEIKLVNAMERDLLTWIELMANPPWLAPEDASYAPDNRPGGVTYWDASSPNNKPEQMQMKGRIDMAEQKTEQKRDRIRRAFFNDLFQLLTNLDEQKREKTAYEVQQMVAEKLLLFSPLFARYTDEKLTPMLARAVDVMARSGRLKPLPDGVPAGAAYDVVYVSKIALAIKSAENQAFATMMTLVEQAAALDPSVVNVINWREGVRDVARNVGTKASLIRTDREVNQITQAQQQAAAAAQQAETAEIATRAVKNLGPEAQLQAGRKIIGGAGARAA